MAARFFGRGRRDGAEQQRGGVALRAGRGHGIAEHAARKRAHAPSRLELPGLLQPLHHREELMRLDLIHGPVPEGGQ
jgi:hypothetical protein